MSVTWEETSPWLLNENAPLFNQKSKSKEKHIQKLSPIAWLLQSKWSWEASPNLLASEKILTRWLKVLFLNLKYSCTSCSVLLVRSLCAFWTPLLWNMSRVHCRRSTRREPYRSCGCTRSTLDSQNNSPECHSRSAGHRTSPTERKICSETSYQHRKILNTLQLAFF